MKDGLKKGITVLTLLTVIFIFLSGCVEHRYYHIHHHHSPDYYRRHHMPPPPGVEIDVHG